MPGHRLELGKRLRSEPCKELRCHLLVAAEELPHSLGHLPIVLLREDVLVEHPSYQSYPQALSEFQLNHAVVDVEVEPQHGLSDVPYAHYRHGGPLVEPISQRLHSAPSATCANARRSSSAFSSVATAVSEIFLRVFTVFYLAFLGFSTRALVGSASALHPSAYPARL